MPILTVFRSRLKPGADAPYGALGTEMTELACTMPGFIEEKTFQAQDGERLTFVMFADQATHEAWRDHPAHRIAQQQGIDSWFSEYHIYSSEVGYSASFVADALS